MDSRDRFLYLIAAKNSRSEQEIKNQKKSRMWPEFLFKVEGVDIARGFMPWIRVIDFYI